MTHDDIETARRFLKQTGWLADTPASFADKLLARCSMKFADRKECVYRLNDPLDGIWGVVTGGCAFEIAPHERGPHLAHVFRPGFWFGELEQFAGISKVASITATRPSTFLHIGQSDLMDLVGAEPECWRWLGLLGIQHLMLALGVIDDGSINDPGRRIAALLLRLADVRDADNPKDPTPELDITQEDLAHLATVSRPTASAHLSNFEKAGLIDRTYGHLTLLDPARLRRLVADNRLP